MPHKSLLPHGSVLPPQTLRTPPWLSPPCSPASTAAATPGFTWSSAATSSQTSPAACRAAAGWGTSSATRTRTAASAGPHCCPACRVHASQSRSETSIPSLKTARRSRLRPDDRRHHLRYVCVCWAKATQKTWTGLICWFAAVRGGMISSEGVVTPTVCSLWSDPEWRSLLSERTRRWFEKEFY